MKKRQLIGKMRGRSNEEDAKEDTVLKSIGEIKQMKRKKKSKIKKEMKI